MSMAYSSQKHSVIGVHQTADVIQGFLANPQLFDVATIEADLRRRYWAIRQLRIFYELQQGILQFCPAPVRLDQLIQTIVDEIGRIVNRQIIVTNEGLSQLIWADAVLLRVVFDVLLHNALHFSPNHAPQIILSQGRTLAQVEVFDWGTEFDRALIKQILNGMALSDKHGIGVFISHQIVKMHNGRFSYDSVPGQTIATITLPLNV